MGRTLFARLDVGKLLNLQHTPLVVHYIGYVEINASRSVVGYAFEAHRNNLCRFGEWKIRQ